MVKRCHHGSGISKSKLFMKSIRVNLLKSMKAFSGYRVDFDEAEVFPKISQKLFFPKNCPKIQKLPEPFKSVQSSIWAQIYVHRAFLHHDILYITYMLENIEILLHYFQDVFLVGTPLKNDFLSETILNFETKPRHVPKPVFSGFPDPITSCTSCGILEKPSYTEFLVGHAWFPQKPVSKWNHFETKPRHVPKSIFSGSPYLCASWHVL
jgi:hypothetical protein